MPQRYLRMRRSRPRRRRRRNHSSQWTGSICSASVRARRAAGGTLMQGLFRNRLADPMLAGVSPGAGLASAAAIVVGDRIIRAGKTVLPFEVLPVAAIAGALVTTIILYRLATRHGRT